jgi:hypothetical protein
MNGWTGRGESILSGLNWSVSLSSSVFLKMAESRRRKDFLPVGDGVGVVSHGWSSTDIVTGHGVVVRHESQCEGSLDLGVV